MKPDPLLLQKAETLTEALPYMQRYACLLYTSPSPRD